MALGTFTLMCSHSHWPSPELQGDFFRHFWPQFSNSSWPHAPSVSLKVMCSHPDYLTWKVGRLFFFFFSFFGNKHYMMNWFPWNSNDLVLVISYRECWIFFPKSDGRSEGEKGRHLLWVNLAKKEMARWYDIIPGNIFWVLKGHGGTLKERRLPVFT